MREMRNMDKSEFDTRLKEIMDSILLHPRYKGMDSWKRRLSNRFNPWGALKRDRAFLQIVREAKEKLQTLKKEVGLEKV